MRVAVVLMLLVIHATGGSSIGMERKILQEFQVSTPVASDGTDAVSSVESGPQLPEGSPSSNDETDQSQSPLDNSQSVPQTTAAELSETEGTQEVVEVGEVEFTGTTPEQIGIEASGSQTGDSFDNSQQGEDVATSTDSTDNEGSEEQEPEVSEAVGSGSGSSENLDGEPVESGPNPGEGTTTEDSTDESSMDGQGDPNVKPDPDVDTVPSAPVSEPTTENISSDKNDEVSPASENVSTDIGSDGSQEGGSQQKVSGCNPFDLWNAVEGEEIEKVKDLASLCPNILENQSKLEVDGEQWGTVLHASVVFEHLEVSRVLLDAGSNVNAVTTNGWTALHLAAAFGLPEIARELLDRGADKNALDSSQQIPLHDACSGGFVELAQLLVNWGSNVNQGNEFGETPLISAAIKGNPEIIKILLEGGADVDLKDNEGQTALIEAAIYGSVDAVQVLLENGANKDIADNEGRTASSSACYCVNYSGSDEFLDCDQSQCGEDVKGRVVEALS